MKKVVDFFYSLFQGISYILYFAGDHYNNIKAKKYFSNNAGIRQCDWKPSPARRCLALEEDRYLYLAVHGK